MVVIAPLSAFDSWIEEVKLSLDPPPVVRRFENHVPAETEILLVNYHRLANYYDTIAAWVSKAPTMVVLDEAHRMKRGWAGEWGRACLSLAYLASRREVLTGTPAPQHPRDFLALLDFLWPTQAQILLPDEALQAQPSPDAGQRVSAAIKPLFARTRKTELGLKDPKYRAIEVPVEGLPRANLCSTPGPLRRDVRPRSPGSSRPGCDGSPGDVHAGGRHQSQAPGGAGSTDGDPEEFRHPPLDIPPDSPLADLIRDYNLYETPSQVRRAWGSHSGECRERDSRPWCGRISYEICRTLWSASWPGYEPAVVHGAVPAISSPNPQTCQDTGEGDPSLQDR